MNVIEPRWSLVNIDSGNGRPQASTWTNVEQNLCRNMVSLEQGPVV